jgi:hypothetical protein
LADEGGSDPRNDIRSLNLLFPYDAKALATFLPATSKFWMREGTSLNVAFRSIVESLYILWSNDILLSGYFVASFNLEEAAQENSAAHACRSLVFGCTPNHEVQIT